MATVSGPMEVIELSDSEGSCGAPPSKSDEHVVRAEWVRRSTRARKASTRFSPDVVETPSVKKNAASSSKVKKIGVETPPDPLGPDKPKRSSSSDSDFAPDQMELIDAEMLINYVEKFQLKITPGKFGINMPIGPDEYVLVDAVDYLRNLGYSIADDGEEESEIKGEGNETAVTNPDRVKEEEVLYESQAVDNIENADDESNESEEKFKKEINFWDENSHMGRSSQSQRSQDSSGADTRDSSSQKSSDEDIDVEALDLGALNRSAANVVRRQLKRSRKEEMKSMKYQLDPEDRRSVHNMMEKIRRNNLANCFQRLYSIVFSDDPNLENRAPKVKILSEAINLISTLRKTQERLAAEQNSLHLKKNTLLETRKALSNMLEAKKATPNENQRVKNYVNSL